MDKAKITIYCFSASPTYVVASAHRDFMMQGGSMFIPSEEIVSFEELEYITLHSTMIQNGRIEFADEQREEIYEALHLNNWKETCLFERDIDTMISHPTMEMLQRIVDMKELAMIERIKSHIVMHENAHDLDVSSRAKDVVEARYRELLNGHLTSEIQIISKTAQVPAADIDKLVAQKVAEQMEKMYKTSEKSEKLNAIATPQAEQQVSSEANKPTSTVKAPPKKRGRPAAKAKTE